MSGKLNVNANEETEQEWQREYEMGLTPFSDKCVIAQVSLCRAILLRVDAQRTVIDCEHELRIMK